MIPDFVTHYARGVPFQSITSLPSEEWASAISQLNETNAWGLNRFSDPDYLSRRRSVERRLREEFIVKGGKPELEFPIYFFLGRHERFEAQARNRGYRISLCDVSPESISFTYGDSLLAYDPVYRAQAGEGYRSPLCAKVYRVDELDALHAGLPKCDPLAIEAQLWVRPGESLLCESV